MVSDLSPSRRSKITDVIISMNSENVRFNFLDASGTLLSAVGYHGDDYVCSNSQLIIKSTHGYFDEYLTVNSRKFEMQFSIATDGNLLLKLVVADKGTGMLVIPYRTHNEYVYRFPRIQ